MTTPRRLAIAVVLILAAAASAPAQTVRITDKPAGLVHGIVYVPVAATAPVERLELLINGVKYSEARGRAMTVQLNVGQYIRRLRLRAVGYDAAGNVAGEDEAVLNDPRPPFRVRLSTGGGVLSAAVLKPEELRVTGVDFFVGEEKVATDQVEPYAVPFDPKDSLYARVVARAADGSEANDVVFFGDGVRETIDVTLQQVPLSIASGSAPLRLDDLTLIDAGKQRKIEALIPASDQPLHVILLIDYSESMLEELPVVKAAARGFARTLLRPQDRIAVVGFNHRTFWLTAFTNDFNAAAAAVDQVRPISETHLYDSVMEMLFELQKKPGRRALVVLTDGADQGSRFKLEHVAHYARYAGIPVYPVVKNRMLTRLMRFGVGRLQARKLGRLAEDTGATHFIIQNERELAVVYDRIAGELRQQYQVVFYSDGAGRDTWHPLAISSRGGHRLRIPRGYFE